MYLKCRETFVGIYTSCRICYKGNGVKNSRGNLDIVLPLLFHVHHHPPPPHPMDREPTKRDWEEG